MNAARRPAPSTPVLIGRHWLFADGSRLPVVSGAEGDTAAPIAPEDLSTVSDDELADLEAALVAEFDRLHDSGTNDVAALTGIAEALDRVRTESVTRVKEAEEARQAIDALAARVHAQADDEGDDDGGDDPGDGDAPAGDGPEGATAEGEREPALVAGAARPAPARRAPASASATARRAGRPSVEPARPRISITAAADLPGLTAGAAVDLTQVATAMHDKARAMSNGSPRVPIARFHLPIPQDRMITERMSAEAALEIVEAASAPASLVAAGGWCTPSENSYELFALDGATGLLDLPTIGISRGGLNIPSYIGYDAADAALFSWTEAQDALVGMTITDLDVATNVATVSTSVPHLLAVGDLVDINVGLSVDGPRTVASIVDADTFTFAVTAPDSTNATGTMRRKKRSLRIPCPTWTDNRLAGYGLSITHGNLTDQAFPELTRRYVQLAMNAHAHRMSEINLGKIAASGNSDTVTVTAIGSDSYGDVMSAVELQAVDYRSQYQMSQNVVLETILPTWVRENLRSSLAMRAGVDMRAVTDQQIDAELAVRKVKPQFVEDYQPMWNGTARTAWPTALEFLMYPAGNFVEGKGTTIDLGVVRDSTLNAENDFTAAWTEEFSLLARRGPKARKVGVTLSTDGVTACCA